LTNDNERGIMSLYEEGPITEVHRELDQLARVSMAALMQMSEAVARRGVRKAEARRDEQVAIARGAGAQLQAGYASQPAGLGGDSAVMGDEPTGPGSPPQSGTGTVTDPVQDAEEPSAEPSVGLILMSDSASPSTTSGTATRGLDQDNAMPGDTGGAPAAGPVTLEVLLGTAHPMPVREEVGAAAAAGPTSGSGGAVEATQQLSVAQGAQFDSGVGIG
jgi:hypothetical protein